MQKSAFAIFKIIAYDCAWWWVPNLPTLQSQKLHSDPASSNCRISIILIRKHFTWKITVYFQYWWRAPMTCCMAPGQFHRPPFRWPLVRWMETSSVLFICHSALFIGGKLQEFTVLHFLLKRVKDCRCTLKVFIKSKTAVVEFYHESLHKSSSQVVLEQQWNT